MSASKIPNHDPFAGPGEMRALCRTLDWAATPLGAVDGWPATLRNTVRTCLESPFPINLWCGPELILIYNDAYRYVLGAKHPWALGQPGCRVWAEIWEQIAPMFSQIREGGPPVYATDAPFRVLRSGEPEGPGEEPNAWFTFSLSAVRDEAGEVIAFLNIVSETTARLQAERAEQAARAKAERAEARLLEVFEQAPSFLAVLRGREHVFEYVNAAYYQLVGRRHLVGRPVLEALHEMRGQGFDELLDRVLESGVPYIGREVAVPLARTPGGAPEERFVDFIYYPLTEVDGSRSGVVAHGYDVTEHVLARREAHSARGEAEQANQAKSRFLASMSHEIRTPINAVMGYTDLLDAGVAGQLNEKQAQYLRRIRESSHHLLGLVNDVLDLSKIEAGELTVTADETSLFVVVHPALQMVMPQAEAKGVSLTEQLHCGRETRFCGDEDRTRQVLINLLSNAVKFTPQGGAITVRCQLEQEPSASAALPMQGPWVVVEVEDTGIGIAPEQLPHIFEAFVQAEGGARQPASGTGLGLTISRHFARLMGGDLTARSEVGKGSTFRLWLPALAQRRALAADGWPRAEQLPAEAYVVPGLGLAGRIVIDSARPLEDRLVESLREDRAVPGADGADQAELENHVSAFLTALGKMMVALDEGGEDSGLLRDSQDIGRMMTIRHGRQRRRLGWERAELQREFHLLREQLDTRLREAMRRHTAAQLNGVLGVLHRLLDAAERNSLDAFDTPELLAAPGDANAGK